VPSSYVTSKLLYESDTVMACSESLSDERRACTRCTRNFRYSHACGRKLLRRAACGRKLLRRAACGRKLLRRAARATSGTVLVAYGRMHESLHALQAPLPVLSFTCFTSTKQKGQILTRRKSLQGHTIQRRATSVQFTCFSSTKVQKLTQKALQGQIPVATGRFESA
jgi:hypothetical protein